MRFREVRAMRYMFFFKFLLYSDNGLLVSKSKKKKKKLGVIELVSEFKRVET